MFQTSISSMSFIAPRTQMLKMFALRVVTPRAFQGAHAAAQRFSRAFASVADSHGNSGTSRDQMPDRYAQLPLLTLYTKTPCPLCDEALEKIRHLSNRFRLTKVDITEAGNEIWFEKYRNDIPVFHLNGEFLMKHRADPDLLSQRLEGMGLFEVCFAVDACVPPVSCVGVIGMDERGTARDAAEVAVVGDNAVGKTSLLRRLTESRISSSYEPTVASNLFSLSPTIDGKSYRIFVHDFSGSPAFREVRAELCRDVAGIILLVDMRTDTAKQSVSNWLAEISGFRRSQKPPLVLVCGNQFDEVVKPERRADVVSLARSRCWDYCECSPATGANVGHLFQTFFKKLVVAFSLKSKSDCGEFSGILRSFGTAEAREALRRIRYGTTPFEKLGLSPSASKEDVNRAYKRLAVLLHPDKTDLLGAEEAFKALNSARNALIPGAC